MRWSQECKPMVLQYHASRRNRSRRVMSGLFHGALLIDTTAPRQVPSESVNTVKPTLLPYWEVCFLSLVFGWVWLRCHLLQPTTIKSLYRIHLASRLMVDPKYGLLVAFPTHLSRPMIANTSLSFQERHVLASAYVAILTHCSTCGPPARHG